MAQPDSRGDREYQKFVGNIDDKPTVLSVAHGKTTSETYLPLKVVDDGNNLGKMVVDVE